MQSATYQTFTEHQLLPVSIISLRIKYASINDLVEALYPLPYFNAIHMLRFWGNLKYSYVL